MAFFLIVFQLYYEMSDDYVFSNLITDGSYNFNFMSSVMACFIGLIQNIIYPVNAYVIVCLLFAFAACTVVTEVLLDRFNLVAATCFTLIFNGFLSINHYGTIAYNHMAVLMSVVGFLCIIHYSNREKWKFGTVLGIAFVIIGSLFRFELFEVCVAVAVFFVIGKSVTEYFRKNKSERKAIDVFKIIFEPKRLVAAVIAVALCFGISCISSFAIKSDKRVDNFIKYTAARSAVYDYQLPDYETHKEEYSKTGIDDNDLLMLRNLYMDDEGAFTYDKLKEIKSVKSSVDSAETSLFDNLKLMVICEAGNLRAVWKNGTVDIRNFGIEAGNKGVLYFFIGILLLVFVLSMKKRNYFIPIAMSLITAFVYVYLWRELKVPFRAVYPVWFSFATYLIYSFSWDELRDYIKKIFNAKEKAVKCVAVICSILLAGAGVYLTSLYNQHIDYYTLSDSQVALRSYLTKNSGKKYELSTNCNYGALSDSIWFTQKTDKDKNYNQFAGTYYRLPQKDYEAEQFGTDNMFKNLYNDDIYFIVDSEDSHADMMKAYLQKYYSNGKTVGYKIVDTVDKYQICKYTLI